MSVPAPHRRLAGALGVTRVARVTGLDRTGIEVACAVRPGGHILQVCNGKGVSFEEAAVGALHETAELWGAENVPTTELVWGSRAELERAGAAAWSATALGSAGACVAPALWSDGLRCAWRTGTELHSGRDLLVPAQAVHCPPAGSPPLGPACIAWSSNGSGCHAERPRAVLHALLEAIEREELSRVLPEGWTGRAMRERMLVPRSIEREAPRTAALVEELGRRGFKALLFDLTGPLGIAVIGALLVDRHGGPIPLTAGYGCALRREEAMRKALQEAAQSRLTDIHGAREDVVPADAEDARALAARCARIRPARDARHVPDASGGRTAPAAVKAVLQRLGRRGFTEVAAVTLPAPMEDLHVVRVVIPRMSVSGLL